MRTLLELRRRLARRRTQPAQIRRLDWRFLLPNPDGGAWDRLVLLGGTRDLARLIVEGGVARRVARRLPARGDADAVVDLRTRGGRLGRVAARLRKGGVLYAERRSSRVEGLCHELHALGLHSVRAWRVHPGFDRREAFVPVGAGGAACWFDDHVIGAARSSAPASRASLDCVVTASRGAADAPPSVLGHPTLHPRLGDARAETLVLTRGDPRDAYRRVAFLPFPPDGAEPLLVAKLWRSADRNADSLREQAILSEIRRLGEAGAPPQVPAPLGVFRWAGLDVAVEEACAGRPFAHVASADSGEERRIETLRRTLEGFADFCPRVVASREKWGGGSAQARVHATIARYEDEFAATPPERRLLERTRARSEQLGDAVVPIVWSHPDLGPGNVLLRSDGIAVLDWSGAAPNLPLLDVLYFTFVATGEITGSRDEAGRRRLARRLFAPGPGVETDRLAAAVREGLDRITGGLDLDPGLLPVLAVALWTGRALGRLDRARAVARGEAGVGAKAGNPYPAVVSALAEDADTFLSVPPGAARSIRAARS